MSKEYCNYCNPWRPEPIVSSWDGQVVMGRGTLRMLIRHHGGGHSVGGTAKVRYCPMCGREL